MKILIGIPAYNEGATIASVITHTRRVMPQTDLVVVNDGSSDHTAEEVRRAGARLLPLPCNLGYSNAIQTIMRYGYEQGYEAVVFIDADGQHNPDYLPGFIAHYESMGVDVLIGSRYVATKSYQGNPFGRRLGMILFSWITGLLLPQRIYDTTSGMKIVNRAATKALLAWHFLDYHTEAIVYLARLGFSISEYPITVAERKHGTSMYSFLSHIQYPLTVLLLLAVTLIQSALYNDQRKHEGEKA